MTGVAKGQLSLRNPDHVWENRKNNLLRLKTAVGNVDSSDHEYQAVLSETLLFCSNDDREVRRTALSLLGELGTPGDDACIQAALARVRDPDSRVRTTALEVLGQLAPAGNEPVIAAVASALQDWHRPARSAALKALRQLASEMGGSAHAAAATAEMLDDPRHEWRQEAVTCISDIAVVGDEGTIQMVCKRLESTRREVRVAAQDALVMLSKRGYEAIVDAVLRRLESELDYTRVAAGQAFMRIVKPSDIQVANKVAERLEHDDQQVRTAALQVLSKFDTKVAKSILLARIEHPKPEVRCSALAGLATVGRGDNACIRAVGKALQDPSGFVRSMAISLLRGLTMDQGVKCSVLAAKLASLAIEHPNVEIQEAGSLALTAIAQAQNPTAPKKILAPQKKTLEEQLNDIRAAKLAMGPTRTPRKTDSDSEDGSEDGLGRVSPEELAIVTAMIEHAEKRDNRLDLDKAPVEDAASVILSLQGMAERAKSMPPDIDDEDADEVDLNDNYSDSGTESEEEEEQPVLEVRVTGNKRLQGFVKKAFLGKMFSKSKQKMAITAKRDLGSFAGKMTVIQQKEGDKKAWQVVEDMLGSGDAHMREVALRNLSAASGLGPGAMPQVGPTELVQRQIVAKKALMKIAVHDTSWQVRVAALRVIESVASESNAELLASANAAASDAIWQVRRAAAKAITSTCISGRAAVDKAEAEKGFACMQALAKDWHGEVSLEALVSLDKLSLEILPVGSGVESTIASALEHRDNRVRSAAAEVLQRLYSMPGREVAVAESAAGMLENEDSTVKEETSKLLTQLGPFGPVVDVVSHCIYASHDEQTRCAALRTLANIAELGDKVPVVVGSNITQQEESKPQHNHAIEAAALVARLGLQDVSATVRQETIRCIKGFNPAAWLHALRAITTLLAADSDSNSDTRCAALRAVSSLFAASDAGSFGGPAENIEKDELATLLELVAACVEHKDAEVRNVATKVLHELAEGGGRGCAVLAISFIAKRLGHESEEVGRSVQAALALLGGCRPATLSLSGPPSPSNSPSSRRHRKADPGGNPYDTARAASEALSSDDPEKRKAGGKVLISLACQGDNTVTVATCAAGHLQNDNPEVVDIAAHVLCQISAEGDPDILKHVGSQLVSMSARTRETALHVLTKLSPQGSIDINALEDGEGDGTFLRQLTANCLLDKVPEVREAAILAFAQLVRPTDAAAVSDLALKLPTMNSAVRKDIMRSLSIIWSGGLIKAAGPREAAAVVTCLEDECAEVRENVARLLRSSQARGHSHVISVAALRLQHPEQQVRDSAVEALLAIAETGSLGFDKGAVAAAAVHLGNQDWDVRRAAVQATIGLVPKDKREYLMSLLSIIEARDEEFWQSVHKLRVAFLEHLCRDENQEDSAHAVSGKQLIRQFTLQSLLDELGEQRHN
eukprot:TRINITY_DN28203_c0_g1_i1.p1 TRINITY_DN28203_c0_g1~~TRINITY_DN28203_c0_g1_i1.p1  ORF type:complete len:1419 (-),score=255.53 TRINITY_DN28203_c0_g1_i1:97-4353(-)